MTRDVMDANYLDRLHRSFATRLLFSAFVHRPKSLIKILLRIEEEVQSWDVSALRI